MSRFVIRNEAWQDWPLDGERGVWFSNVQGLGIQNANNTADLGNGFSLYMDTGSYPVVPVPGDLFFMPPDAYATYREFISFIMSSSEIVLIYTPYGTEEYYRRAKIEYVTKGVTDKRGRLDCTISILPLTPWYSPRAVTLTLQGQTEDATTYDFTYTDSLVYGSDLAGSYAAEITPAGHQPAAVRLSYAGPLEHPTLTLTGVNSEKEYARCEVQADVDGLDYSSLQRDSYVRDSDGEDLLDYVTMEKDPYIRIPLGEPCILRIQTTSAISQAADVSIYYYFRSV